METFPSQHNLAWQTCAMNSIRYVKSSITSSSTIWTHFLLNKTCQGRCVLPIAYDMECPVQSVSVLFWNIPLQQNLPSMGAPTLGLGSCPHGWLCFGDTPHNKSGLWIFPTPCWGSWPVHPLLTYPLLTVPSSTHVTRFLPVGTLFFVCWYFIKNSFSIKISR